jgi:chloride channel protein, CIC family
MLVLAAWAVGIGAVGALVAWALLHLIRLATNLFFFGRLSDAAVEPADAHNAALTLGAPVLGGLVVGLMARYGSERIRGHGMPETIEAVLTKGSRVRPRVAFLKPLSAAVSIGSGGPFGAEGPIIMTGGAVGSVLAQHLRLTADERKTLLVAGAAAGMTGVFNTPLAAVVLAVELLLFEWRPRSFVPVAAAAVTAAGVRVPLLGGAPLFPTPSAPVQVEPSLYAFCVLAGLVAGLVAAVLTALVYLSEDTFGRLPLHWMWWPAIGGVVIGLGGLVEPRALGVGYAVIADMLAGRAGLGLVVGILVVKSLIWGLSLGSGTSGGVVAPLLLVGSSLGAFEAATVFPHEAPGFWALVSLAALLSGAMRVPLTSVVFALELTRDVEALLPMTIASATAYGLSVLLLKRSILTEKIARRGFHLTREYSVDPLEVLFVREVMDTEVTTLRPDHPLAEAVPALEAPDRPDGVTPRRQRLFPVTDDEGHLVGVVTRRELRRAGDAPGRRTVADVMVGSPVTAHPDETLRAVAYRMAEHGVTRCPVVARDESARLGGLVTLPHLLEGRVRDLVEERDSERVLRFRLPLWSRRRES